MKMTALKCPNCQANLKLDTKNQDSVFCPYCGSQIQIDNEKQEFTYTYNKNINIVNRTINDAEIIRANNEKIKLYNKRLKIFEPLSEYIPMIVILIIIFIFLSIMGIFESAEKKQALSAGKISAGNCSDYEERNYIVVQQQLESAGFTDIKLIDLDDSGIFKNKKDTVESVSINGNSTFHYDDYFDKDDTVVISYH